MRTALDAAGNLELGTPYEENLIWYYDYCDSLEKQIDREYTVNVSYKNLTASYAITTSNYAVDNLIMVEPEIPMIARLMIIRLNHRRRALRDCFNNTGKA